MPWWEDAMVNFMISGGYNVASHIKLVMKILHLAIQSFFKKSFGCNNADQPQDARYMQ